MGNFFSTLFKWNWVNIGKAIVGGASGLMSYPAIIAALPLISPPIAIVVAVVIGAGTALGLHGYHVADPPQVPLGNQKLK
jgi:hypothetical protein